MGITWVRGKRQWGIVRLTVLRIGRVKGSTKGPSTPPLRGCAQDYGNSDFILSSGLVTLAYLEDCDRSGGIGINHMDTSLLPRFW